jgi:hypothetical protein
VIFWGRGGQREVGEATLVVRPSETPSRLAQYDKKDFPFPLIQQGPSEISHNLDSVLFTDDRTHPVFVSKTVPVYLHRPTLVPPLYSHSP